MATPRAAIGTLLQKEDTPGSGNYVTVALVGNIDGPNLKGDTIDVTNHDNVDMYKEFIVGLKEGGDVKFKLYFDPLELTHQDVIDTFENRTVANWKIVLPVTAAPAWSFAAVVTAFDPKHDVNGALTADCTVKTSGRPVFA
jgi:predicted secreted protein